MYLFTNALDAMAASTTAQSAPIVHAIGGSIGSALALLLFYPIERARIEIQTQASAISSSSDDGGDDFHSVIGGEENNIDSVHAEVVVDTTSVSSTQQPIEACGSKVVRSSSSLYHIRDESSSWTPLEEQDNGRKKGSTFLPQRTLTTAATTKSSDSPSWSMNSSVDTDTSTSYDENGDDDTTTMTALQQKQKELRRRIVSEVSKRSILVRVLIDLHSRGELYHGVAPIISTIFTSQFIFFFVHAYVKRLLQSTRYFTRNNATSGRSSTGNADNRSSSYALLSLSSSCIAGVGNVLLTNPLWVTNMAIVTGETKTQNLTSELVRLWKTYGVRHLWDGTSASILLVSNPIIQFFCYEQIKHARLRASGTDQFGPVEAFLIAALAKGIATVTTYPLQLAQTLLRIGNSNDDDIKHEKSIRRHRHQQHKQYKGTIDCLIQLYKTNKSFAAWFTGMRAKLLQTVLTAAFTFLTYEQILGAVQTALVMRDNHRTVAKQTSSSATASKF
jgi:adenine nucleotide transporter 17